MGDSNGVKLGPDGPIRHFHETPDLLLDMINLLRERIARAVEAERVTGVPYKNLSVDLKRLNTFVLTLNIVLSSPQAKAPTQPAAGPGFIEELMVKLLEEGSGKKRPKKAPKKASEKRHRSALTSDKSL